MNWLFVTTEFPWPLNHGTWLRVYHLARVLSDQGERVSVLSYEGSPEGVGKYGDIRVGVVPGPKGVPLRRGRSRCFLAPYAYDRKFGDCIAGVAEQFDVVVLVRPNLLQYSREASAGGVVLADVVDDPMLEEGQGSGHGSCLRQWVRQKRFLLSEYHYERTFLDRVNCAVFVSEYDTGSFARRHRRTRAVTIPNGVDLSYFARPNGQQHHENGHATVAFLGNLAHPPNRDAALFLLRDVAPWIWRERPETRFTIIGSNPGPELTDLAGPRVDVTGWVEDVRPMLWSSTVVLLPMRTGTGIKNKLLESWAAGLGVVATPLACQGVPARDGENLLVGQTAKELAERTLCLLNDPTLRGRVAQGGYSIVRDHLTWSMAGNRLRELAFSVQKGKTCPLK